MENGTISAVIVDDDAICREHLSDLMSQNAKQIEVREVCVNGKAGIAAINKWKPDLVFLDVEMPDMSGFDMLKKFPSVPFEVIFTTSHEHYAIRAIRFAALDYLVKPVRADMLQEAVSRSIEKIKGKKNNSADPTPEIISDPLKALSNLAIPTLEGFIFVDVPDIIRCESDDRYTKVFLSQKKMILASRTLGEFEDLLQGTGFLRIHKSHLIHLKHLKRYIRGEGGQVVMSDDSVLDVSRRKKDDLLKAVSQFR